MKFSRPCRVVAAIVALISTLFMQLAVASYACPGQNGSQYIQTASTSADMQNQDMSGCSEGMDRAQPNVCHAFGQAGNQSLDKPPVPPVQPFMAAELTLLVTPLEITYFPAVAHPEQMLLTRATAPPLAIRNCCFRI